MAVRKIVVMGNETLRKKSKPVEKFDGDLATLLDDMKTTMIESNGMGIAAVQVGVLRRAVIVQTGEDEYLELVNPEIVETSGKVTDSEGCLSVPGFYCEVTRPEYVKVKAFDREGKPFEFETEDYFARCVCHELDHLEGKLFVDLTPEGRKYKRSNGVD